MCIRDRQKIQAKYKGKTDPESRQAMTQETMDLYKKTGTNLSLIHISEPTRPY